MPLPDHGLRDFGSIVPGDTLTAPVPAEPSARTPPRAPEQSSSGRARSILAADRACETDLLGLDAPLAVLGALAVHPRAETPSAIGLLGGPGAGKTSALRMLLWRISAAGRAAQTGSGAGAQGKVLVVEIDAAALEGPPVVALADRLHTSLAGRYPALVGEAIHASRDSRLAAREAFDALDAARRKLSGERLALENEEARRAGLVETVLFEAAGTRIDAYVRSNRGRLKSRLAGLGVEGEPIRAFKQLVLRTADGALAKASLVLQAVWAFKGQASLVVLAALLALAAFGLDWAAAERAAWLGRLREIDSTRAAADWLEANVGLLETARHALLVGAGLALAANVIRALRLVLPVFRAGALLKEDVAQRRRQADVEFGHEIRRVETLAAEVDALASSAAEAERRAAEEREGNAALAEASPFLDDPLKRRAERFIAAVGRLVALAGGSRQDAKGQVIEAPHRIVVALDGLDALDDAQARDTLAAAHAAFGPGFVLLIAGDPTRLKAAAGAHGLDAWIQIPFQVGECFARSDPSALVRSMLDETPDPGAEGKDRGLPRVDLDAQVTEGEAGLLAALAPLAGRSPRAVKRFVNLYRLARFLCPEHKGMLALMLAIDAGATEAEIEAFEEALGSTEKRLDLDHLGAGPRLGAAMAAVRRLSGDDSLEGARRAAETARLFSFGRR